MGKGYGQLSLEERDKITLMRAEGKKVGEIARALDRDKSTISRELNRNASPEYKLYMSHRAQGRYEERRKRASRRFRLKNDLTKGYVNGQLVQKIGTSTDYCPFCGLPIFNAIKFLPRIPSILLIDFNGLVLFLFSPPHNSINNSGTEEGYGVWSLVFCEMYRM